MNRNEALLGKLADWRPPQGRQSLQVLDSTTGWATTVTADHVDQLGCLVWELTLRKNVPVAMPLGEWAKRVADRATGLLETLGVIEVDATKGEALLRSESPASKGDQVAYYEVHLATAGAASLRRYGASKHGGKREQVGFALTHEALAKLAADLTDAV
jgi:hypothetical protein